MSCHLAIEVGDAKYLVEELHCRFLLRHDDGNYGCSVYEKRLEMAPWCYLADEAVLTGSVATDCPYASGIPNFRGREWASPEIRAKLIPVIRRRLIDEGLPIAGSPRAALRVLNVDGETWEYSEQKDRFVFYLKRAGA